MCEERSPAKKEREVRMMRFEKEERASFSLASSERHTSLPAPVVPSSEPILSLQGSSGFWISSSTLLKLLGYTGTSLPLPDCCQDVKNRAVIFTTVVVCVFLRKKFQSDKARWKPAIDKAVAAVAPLIEPHKEKIAVAANFVALTTNCDSGHKLASFTLAQLISESDGYSRGLLCDLCAEHIDPGFTGTLLHCTVCGYDVCPKCQTGTANALFYLARKFLVSNKLV
eukprot:TRINITY_DN854_c0_g4_i2.p1 TRINITY_DN854_c0_g4~~TRINITY_DN854_c0_g4_i2.p1  ORF type:complete len:226 (-),score=38.05 TRINITY_DN854_c0_g4_i2:93-770(-)